MTTSKEMTIKEAIRAKDKTWSIVGTSRTGTLEQLIDGDDGLSYGDSITVDGKALIVTPAFHLAWIKEQLDEGKLI